jgi:hypothetical protein
MWPLSLEFPDNICPLDCISNLRSAGLHLFPRSFQGRLESGD